MNKTTLTALVATAFALTLAAHATFADDSQPAPPTTAAPTQTGHHLGDGHLIKELGLSKDQLKEIKSIKRGVKAQVENIKNDTTLSAADKKTKLQALRKETRQQVLAILTPDQIAKLKQLRQARREARQNGAAPTTGADE
jgi:Spy/CpxP family protein refolding chaperone